MIYDSFVSPAGHGGLRLPVHGLRGDQHDVGLGDGHSHGLGFAVSIRRREVHGVVPRVDGGGNVGSVGLAIHREKPALPGADQGLGLAGIDQRIGDGRSGGGLFLGGLLGGLRLFGGRCFLPSFRGAFSIRREDLFRQRFRAATFPIGGRLLNAPVAQPSL